VKKKYSRVTDLNAMIQRHYRTPAGFSTYQSGQSFNSVAITYLTHYGTRFSSPVLTVTNQVNNVLPAFSWATYFAKAMGVMLPSFDEGKNSLVNFVLEMKDFKRLATMIFDRSSDKMDFLLEAIGQKQKGNPFAKASRAHLSWQFAWKPLFRDVATLYSTLAKFRDKCKEYNALQGATLQRYYGIDVPGTEIADSTSAVLNTNAVSLSGGGFHSPIGLQTHYHASRPLRYHATMRYRYKIIGTDLATWQGELDALLDTLGLNLNPAILWNAIPFSFVLDWIVKVGDWLEQFKVTHVTFQTEILR
jgi:hypothetical protein